MKTSLIKSAAVGFVATVASSLSHAVPVTFFDTIVGGQTSFSNTVTGTGATVNTQNLSGLSYGNSWNFADFNIQTTNGSNKSISGPSVNTSTGQMIGINPSSSNYHLSGITFIFNSAVNALGFEVGDWGTCCTPSSLYISFDGGSTQLVGTANTYSDNPTVAAGGGYNNDTIFVGAIDDTDTFTTVTFYGDGYGEFLTAGGTIYYSTVGIGSVPPTNAVSEPAGLALLGLGLAGLGFVRRNKKA